MVGEQVFGVKRGNPHLAPESLDQFGHVSLPFDEYLNGRADLHLHFGLRPSDTSRDVRNFCARLERWSAGGRHRWAYLPRSTRRSTRGRDVLRDRRRFRGRPQRYFDPAPLGSNPAPHQPGDVERSAGHRTGRQGDDVGGDAGSARAAARLDGRRDLNALVEQGKRPGLSAFQHASECSWGPRCLDREEPIPSRELDQRRPDRVFLDLEHEHRVRRRASTLGR